MKNYITWLLLLVVLPLLSIFYFLVTFGDPVDKTFLSISTFLFSIFTGFFISRQANRFNKVREIVAHYDGLLTNIYRTSSHISADLQKTVGGIIHAHYDTIFSTKRWDYHFTHKSSTLSSLHAALDEHVDDESVTKVSNQALGAIIKGLAGAQDARKSMLALSKERIPKEQWLLIVFFAAIVISAVSTLSSAGLLLPSILKAGFVVAVLAVLYILFRLNNLVFAEDLMGQESALDVIAIIEQRK